MQIYKITNLINKKSYIGKDVKNRKNYFGSGIIIKNAIKKYGKENFIKKILFECEDHNILKQKEKDFIIVHNTKYPTGYNITGGGDGGDVVTNNPNKEQIRMKQSGRVPWNKGLKMTDVIKKKVSNSCKKHWSQTSFRSSSCYKKGKNHKYYGTKQSKQLIEKRISVRRKNGTLGRPKIVYVFDLNFNKINIFKSVLETAKYYNISKDRVAWSARLGKKTDNKYFKYKEK